jgi:hypothetical protein
LFKQEPLSANASFDNAYKGGVTIDTNGGTTVTCEVGSWGNSGVWDNTPIVNNGSIHICYVFRGETS